MPNPSTPDHIIVISATTAVPHPLTLTEGTTSSSTETGDQNFTTEVNSGDTVQWQFDSSSNVSGISGISVTQPFFSQLPTSNNQWIGRVGTSNGKKAQESYSIDYSVTGAPANPYNQDPIIKMKN